MNSPETTARPLGERGLSPGEQPPDSLPPSDVPPGGVSPGGVSPGGVSRFVIVLAVTGTILLALGAFWLSFTHLRDLAVLSGVPVGQAWMWPLIVDGVILEATISVVALRNAGRAARRFAWLLLGAGAGVSVAANITHAVVAADTRVPVLIAALVASVPPLVLLAMTHLTVELTRNTTPTTTREPSIGPRVAENPAAVAPTDDPHRSVQRAVPESSETNTVPRAAAARGGGGRQREVRARALVLDAEGVSKRQIAAQLGVHPTTVGRWVNAPDRQQDGDPS